MVVSLASGCFPKNDERVSLRVDVASRHQTIEGWGATVAGIGIPLDAWLNDPTAERYDQLKIEDPVPENLKAKIMDDAVFDLGLNRFRLEIGPQVVIGIDNGNPQEMNGYRFKWQDFKVRKWLLPMKQRIEQRGEKMVLYISYDQGSKLTPSWLLQPDEYAKMAVATLSYLKKQYDIEPDYWSVLNEPGNHRPGNPELVAKLISVTGAKIKESGFSTRMSGPEVVTPKQITAYMKALNETPGANAQMGQLTYHLYWDPKNIKNRNEIREWAKRLGVTTAQTEWLEGKGLGVAETLYLDLTEANASVWEQYGLCYTANSYNSDGGGDYFVLQPDYTGYYMNKNAWYLRQFMKYIRPGDVRIDIGSPNSAIKPVAFLQPNGRETVVVINSAYWGEQIQIENLAPGSYEVSVTDQQRKGETLAKQVVESGSPLPFHLPRRAVVTFHGI
jgi:O-glycosyl hydrolase